MKPFFSFFIACVLIFSANSVMARDTLHQFEIADVMNAPENASRLEGVAFYFGDQSHPPITRNHGEYSTNKKTNAFNKSDLHACQWTMMSALIQLHQRAISLGANAVVNIKSNYKNNRKSSETQYTCGAGGIMAGVALLGTMVEIE